MWETYTPGIQSLGITHGEQIQPSMLGPVLAGMVAW